MSQPVLKNRNRRVVGKGRPFRAMLEKSTENTLQREGTAHTPQGIVEIATYQDDRYLSHGSAYFEIVLGGHRYSASAAGIFTSRQLTKLAREFAAQAGEQDGD